MKSVKNSIEQDDVLYKINSKSQFCSRCHSLLDGHVATITLPDETGEYRYHERCFYPHKSVGKRIPRHKNKIQIFMQKCNLFFRKALKYINQ